MQKIVTFFQNKIFCITKLTHFCNKWMHFFSHTSFDTGSLCKNFGSIEKKINFVLCIFLFSSVHFFLADFFFFCIRICISDFERVIQWTIITDSKVCDSMNLSMGNAGTRLARRVWFTELVQNAYAKTHMDGGVGTVTVEN